MTTHRVMLTHKSFFELLSGDKTAEIRDCSDTSKHQFRVGDSMHFTLTDETGNPTCHEMTRHITHIQYGGGLEEVCMLSYGPIAKVVGAEAVTNVPEQAAFDKWSDTAPPLNEVQRECARNGWLAALQWIGEAPGQLESHALYRAATIVRRGKQHNRGARGIDSHLEKAAQRIEKRADFDRHFYAYVNSTPATPQFVCHISAEDAKFLQEIDGRVGALKMDLFLDADSAGTDTKMLYILPSPVNHDPLPVDCEADRPVFESRFPSAKSYQLRENGEYWDDGGLRDDSFLAGPNAEWRGWKACYEHHVLPMGAEIERLKIHHRTEYRQAYWVNEAQGLGV
jgi:hypothetical protein